MIAQPPQNVATSDKATWAYPCCECSQIVFYYRIAERPRAGDTMYHSLTFLPNGDHPKEGKPMDCHACGVNQGFPDERRLIPSDWQPPTGRYEGNTVFR